MILPRPVKAVVFDMDGLLVDTESVVFEAMKATARRSSLDMPFEVFMRMVGLPHVQSDQIVREHFGEGFDLELWRQGVREHFYEFAQAGVMLKAGVAELLDELDAREMPRAVATSSNRESVEHSLGQHGLLGRFHAFVTRDVVVNFKPHPEPFLKAAEALGVAPEDCLALEDSHNGVRAAASAGMMTVMVPDLLQPTDEMQSLCVRIAHDLHEVRELLQAQG
ncbi:HAD family hydrolase [Phenylobacterium sp.]|uniref:HAD family hydrolase n=1 Tax=Phenylobacterium sp. TaxID=1871053 RepID=UPI0035B3FBBA